MQRVRLAFDSCGVTGLNPGQHNRMPRCPRSGIGVALIGCKTQAVRELDNAVASMEVEAGRVA
jgi:hypothetical protein